MLVFKAKPKKKVLQNFKFILVYSKKSILNRTCGIFIDPNVLKLGDCVWKRE